jgi:hypothetical protein
MWTALKRVVVVALVISALPGPVASAGAVSDDRLFSPHSSPFGRPYAEWFAEYQEWLNEIPTPVNPFVDPASPENCDLEDGHVVFLEPQGPPCSVPPGKAVGIPFASWECSTAEGLGRTYAELRRCAVDNYAADFGPESLRFSVRIDGRVLPNPRAWTIVTPVPADLIDFPEDNIWDAVPGPSKSVTKGLFYILRPLSPGAHRVVIDLDHDEFGELTLVSRLRVAG